MALVGDLCPPPCATDADGSQAAKEPDLVRLLPRPGFGGPLLNLFCVFLGFLDPLLYVAQIKIPGNWIRKNGLIMAKWSLANLFFPLRHPCINSLMSHVSSFSGHKEHHFTELRRCTLLKNEENIISDWWIWRQKHSLLLRLNTN